MKALIIFILLAPLLISAQPNHLVIPKDTSFTVKSAAKKIHNDFPQAIPVSEFDIKSIKAEIEVVYYSLGDRNLHADIFYPIRQNDEKFPAIILIHGGGWASGNKSHLVPMAQKLAEDGFFSATVEHRLSPEAKYPAAIVDLKTAVKWVKANAGKYHIDTTKIAVLGTSSGATLASFVGTTGKNPQFTSHPIASHGSDEVQAIVNIDGILDFTDPAESGKDQNPEKPSAGAKWFGFTYKENPEIWVEASPLTYANEHTPPTLFINSALPRFHAGRDEYLKILSLYNTPFDTLTIPETPHPFWLFHPWFDQTVPKVSTFLKEVFE